MHVESKGISSHHILLRKVLEEQHLVRVFLEEIAHVRGAETFQAEELPVQERRRVAQPSVCYVGVSGALGLAVSDEVLTKLGYGVSNLCPQFKFGGEVRKVVCLM